MTLKKYFPIALFIGVEAAVLQALDQMIAGAGLFPVLANGGGWIAFQAWAMYFLAGCNIKGGMKAGIGYILGMVASIAIFVLGGVLGGLGWWAMPVTLVILVPAILYLDQAPDYFNMVPAVFVGAGVFFGMMSYCSGASYATVFTAELAYAVIGLICGWITITFRGWYDPRFVDNK